MGGGWTTVGDIATKVGKRWERGVYLRPYAEGDEFEPLRIPIRGPSTIDLRDDFDGVIAWADRFWRESGEAPGKPRFVTERRAVKGRGIGTNELPCAVRFEHFDQLVAFLDVSADVARLDAIIESTETHTPSVLPWVMDHPRDAIAAHEIWPELLDTVNWIAAHETNPHYLRHIDVPNVDTKFVERHQRLLTQLLSLVLPADQIDPSARDFVGRFGFKAKPVYTRFRFLDDQSTFPSALTELRLRTDELAQVELPVRTVFVVENEISYLAFPAVADAIVVFGEGFHSATLEQIEWLNHKDVVYWGDIDTHGFAILDRLRARFSSVSSILMDRDTLLAHPLQYVTEPTPTAAVLPHLTVAEAALYADLIEDRFGPSIRLEQERIRFSLIREALAPWGVDA